MIKLLEQFLNKHNINLVNENICIGISTGVDSTVLLHSLLNLKKKINFNLILCHVNHGKREQSNIEEQYIIDFSKENNLILEVLHLNLTEIEEDNFQSAARIKRLEFFNDVMNKYNSNYLFLAHHLNDDIETSLMHIIRGSNLKGYAGISEVVINNNNKLILRPFLNIRFVLCFGVAWMITNGWAYIFLFVGPKFNISWMTAVGTAYLAFLWLPITPEKIVTIPLAMVFQRWFFKNDEKTRKILHDMHEQAKTDFQKVKSKLSRKKKKVKSFSRVVPHVAHFHALHLFIYAHARKNHLQIHSRYVILHSRTDFVFCAANHRSHRRKDFHDDKQRDRACRQIALRAR